MIDYRYANKGSIEIEHIYRWIGINKKKKKKEFLEEIKNKHRDETIVLVSHGYLIKVLLSILHGWPVQDFYKVKLMENSSFAVDELV